MLLDPFTKTTYASFLTKLSRYFYQTVPQISAGTIVYFKKSGPPQILLIYRGGVFKKWIFPKGKVEYSTDIQKEALRETYEETGLKVDIEHPLPVNEFTFYVDSEKKCIQKQVYYFLAQAKSQKVSLTKNPDSREAKDFSSYKWVTIDEAISLSKYQIQKNTLLEAKRLLKI